MSAEQVAALARIVHFACVEIDGEFALRHRPEDHERVLAVALENADPADIAALAARPEPRFAPPRTEVDRIAQVLIAEWERREGPVTASYVATFADLARAALAARPAPEPLAAASNRYDFVEAVYDCLTDDRIVAIEAREHHGKAEIVEALEDRLRSVGMVIDLDPRRTHPQLFAARPAPEPPLTADEQVWPPAEPGQPTRYEDAQSDADVAEDEAIQPRREPGQPR